MDYKSTTVLVNSDCYNKSSSNINNKVNVLLGRVTVVLGYINLRIYLFLLNIYSSIFKRPNILTICFSHLMNRISDFQYQSLIIELTDKQK